MWSRLLGIVFGALILIQTPAMANVRVTFSPGGVIREFYEQFTSIRLTGEKVVIDGLCISACTMVTGLVPNDQVCVTPFARLAFHSASSGEEFSKQGTRLLWAIYPEHVRTILRNHDWASGDTAHPDLIYVEGSELASIYKPCSPETLAEPYTLFKVGE